MYRFIREDHPMPKRDHRHHDFTAVSCTGAQGAGHADTGGCVRGVTDKPILENCMPRLTCVGCDYKLFGKAFDRNGDKAIHEEPPRDRW